MSLISESAVSERKDETSVAEPLRYERLDSVDRFDAETLNKFYQANRDVSHSATRLANLAAAQTFVTGLPLATVDFVALYLSVFITSGVVERAMGLSTKLVENQTAFFISLIILPVAHLAGLYPGIGHNSIVEFRQLARSLFVSLFVLAGIGWFCFPVHWAFYGISAVITFCVALPAAVTARFFARRICKQFRWWGVPTLILAEPERAFDIYRRLTSMGEQGFRPAGVLLEPGQYWGADPDVVSGLIPVFDFRQVDQVAIEQRVTYVIVSPQANHAKNSLFDAALAVIPNRVLLSSDAVNMGIWDHLYCVGATSGLRLSGGQSNGVKLRIKRAVDVSLAVAALLLGFPLWGLICLAIRSSSPGPILYGQRRVGKHGHEFTTWKFRTMVDDADEMLEQYFVDHPAARREWEQTHKLTDDPRITRVGRLLRSTGLDELPQLLNIIRGEMSLVGPRPIIDSPTYDRCYITDYPAEFEAYKTVRPGLTGLWQVRCRNRGVYELRIYYDMYYIRNWCVWMDAYLVLRTFKTVLFREGH